MFAKFGDGIALFLCISIKSNKPPSTLRLPKMCGYTYPLLHTITQYYPVLPSITHYYPLGGSHPFENLEIATVPTTLWALVIREWVHKKLGFKSKSKRLFICDCSRSISVISVSMDYVYKNKECFRFLILSKRHFWITFD